MDESNKIEEISEVIEQKTTYYPYPRTLPNATATLVLGILSIVMCGPGLVMGIIAIVLHKKDKNLYYTNKIEFDQSYKSARAGYICGIIGLSLSALFVVFYILYFVFIISMFAASNGYTEV